MFSAIRTARFELDDFHRAGRMKKIVLIMHGKECLAMIDQLRAEMLPNDPLMRMAIIVVVTGECMHIDDSV